MAKVWPLLNDLLNEFLDISIDENLYEVLNELAQNSSAAISESVLAQTEPSAKLWPLVY